MNYSNLRTQILAAMKYPPKITAQALQEQLINIVNGLDLGALLLGVATPSLTPNTEANGFYFGLQPGTYTNFPTINGETITVDSSEVAIIVRSGNYWSKIHITTYPTIDPTTKHWMIGNEDTGVIAEGVTPHIDPESGNWFIGTTDTGIHAQGAPGVNAVNPFKGWYIADITGEAGSKVVDDTANLPADPVVGDYAYVKTLDITGTAPSQTETPVVKIYECATAGTWSDSGRAFNPDYSQSFQTGQEVNETPIDETHLEDPVEGSLAKANDVKDAFDGISSQISDINDDLEDKLDKTITEKVYVPVTALSSGNFYVTAHKTAPNQNFNSSYFPVTAGETYQIIGRYGNGTGSYLYGFSSNGTSMIGDGYDRVTDETKGQIVQKSIVIPNGITHVIVTWYGDTAGAQCNLITDSPDAINVVDELKQVEENKQNIEALASSMTTKASNNLTLYSEIGVRIYFDEVRNGYIGNSSIVASESFRTSFFPVKEGHKYVIKGKYGTGNAQSTGSRLFATFADGVMVNRYMLGNTDMKQNERTVEFVVPEGLSIDHIAVEYYATKPYATCFEYAPVETTLTKSSADTIDYVRTKKSFNMLCLGNSFTQDTISYVPYLLKEAEPNMDINIYFVYYAGATIAQYVAYTENKTVIMDGPVGDNISIEYANNGGQCTVTINSGTPETGNYILYWCNIKAGGDDSWEERWHSQTGKSFEEIIGLQKWDLITIQQGGQYNYKDYDHYFEPFVTRLSYYLLSRTGYSCKLGYIMTHASYSDSDSVLNTRYVALAANANRLMQETPIEVLLPYATAVQNARSTFLDSYGENGHMSNDNVHLVDGVGCLSAAVANAQAILEHIRSARTVLGSKLHPSTSWCTSYNIPGRSTSSVGLSRYNEILCQQCAIMAYKHPFETTNMVEIGLCKTYEIYIPWSSFYTPENPICSANQGENWSTRLIVSPGMQIDNVTVTMGGNVIDNAWDAATNTITILGITGNVSLSVSTSVSET